MKNKRGYTLVEIIVVIAIIGIIGVSGTVLVIKGRENSLNKKRNEAFKVFDNALDVYLSNHSEILTNLEDNAEGAVVTFEVLKNEGLVSDNIIDPKTNTKVDYKNNYYVLSDAVMLKNEEEAEEDVCDGQVSLNVLKSWNTLSDKVNTDDIIYVCPKSDNNNNLEDINDLKERIKALEYSVSTLNVSDDNYVLFDVTSPTSTSNSDYPLAYWSLTDTDYWHIIDITGDEITLMYSSPVLSNNVKKIKDYDKLWIKNEIKNKCYCFDDNERNIVCDYDVINTDICISASSSFKPSTFTIRDYIRYNDVIYDIYNASYYKEGTILSSKSIKIPKIYTKMIDNTTYYCHEKENGTYYKYDSIDGWTLADIRYNIDEKVTGKISEPSNKKDFLWNSINDKLMKYIISDEYHYSFTQTAKGDISESGGSGTEDKLGILSYNKISQDYLSGKQYLIGKSFLLGKLYLGWKDYVFVTVTNGIAKGSGDANENCGYDKTRMICREKTFNYFPVIKLKNAKILSYGNKLEENEYPNSYINERNNCIGQKLGTKDCPYIIKFNDEIYSHNGLTS